MPNKVNTPTDTLRIKVWYAAVNAQCGELSAYQLELLLRDKAAYDFNENGNLDRWRIAEKWRAGLHEPSEKYVNRGELIAPGSKLWLTHPLWQVGKLRDAPLGAFDDYFRTLSPFVQAQIFAPSPGYRPQRRSLLTLYDISPALRRIWHGGDAFCLAALCALALEQELDALNPKTLTYPFNTQIFHRKLIKMALSITVRMVTFPPFRDVIPELIRFLAPIVFCSPQPSLYSLSYANEDHLFTAQFYNDQTIEAAISQGLIRNSFLQKQELLYWAEFSECCAEQYLVTHQGEAPSDFHEEKWCALKRNLTQGIRWRQHARHLGL